MRYQKQLIRFLFVETHTEGSLWRDLARTYESSWKRACSKSRMFRYLLFRPMMALPPHFFFFRFCVSIFVFLFFLFRHGACA